MRARHDFPQLPLALSSLLQGQNQRETATERARRLFGPAPAIRELHPSAATLDAVRALRDMHFANGHTPKHDAIEHGPAFFTTAAREFLQRAEHARSPVKQRRRRIAAIAMLVALLDREDFLTSQTEQEAEHVS